MQETRVLVETKGTTGEETISYWFDLPIDVAEFEEKLGVGAESGDYRIIEKVLPYADEVHEHTSVYQLNELDFMYRQLSSDMQEEYVSLILYTHTLPNSTLSTIEYLTALIARIKLYVLCGLFSYKKNF